MHESYKAIPSAVLRRLTRYFSLLQEVDPEGRKWISSREMADRLGLTSSTVRQDLSYVDFYGTSKCGYNTAGMRNALSSILGADIPWSMVIVGAGNMGRALALHEEFARRGFYTVALFDSDRKKIGLKVGKLKVRDVRDMAKVLGKQPVDIGIIAVPAVSAQRIADMLVLSGVRGVLNLALSHVVAPEDVPVADSRVVSSLLELSHRIKTLRSWGKRGRDGGNRRKQVPARAR